MVGATDSGVDPTPIILLVLAYVAVANWRTIGRWLARRWAPSLRDKRKSASDRWGPSDQRLLDAMTLAADLRRKPPAPDAGPFPLKRGEVVTFTIPDCGVSLLDYGQVEVPRWGTKLIQKSAAGYVVTPLINSVRNSNARAKGKRLMRRQAVWTERAYGTVYLTNRRMVFDQALGDDPIKLRSISKIKREPSGVSFVVGVETKTTLPGKVNVTSPNDDRLYVALVYCVTRKVPKVLPDPSFRARAAAASIELPDEG